MFRCSPLALLIAGLSSAAWAQQAEPPAAAAQPEPLVDAADDELGDESGGEIVVTGQRLPGSVLGDIDPEFTLDRREIRALGASNVAELLQLLAPQTRSGRGRGGGEGPVVLVNGRRISGFAEIRNLPPEAILRTEVLPEEVALQYGFRADQRVVNFVLRPRFGASLPRWKAVWPPMAGAARARSMPISCASTTMAAGTSTSNMSGRARSWKASATSSAPRRRPAWISPASAPCFPATEQASIGGTLNRTVFGDVSATLNARLDASESESLFGLPTGTNDPGGVRPLTRDTDTRSGRIGFALNGTEDRWRWSLTGSYDRAENRTLTDVNSRASPRERDRAKSDNSFGTVEAVANGPVFALPAGNVTTSLRAGFDTRDLASKTERGALIVERELGRDRGNGQVSLDVPIADRSRAVLGFLGDLSLNANLAAEQLSDFGTLVVYGAGLNWEPIPELDLIASFTDEEGAPTIQQLGDPVLRTPNVRVFDFVRGETVDVTRIEGGSPDLRADSRRVYKLGLTIRPLDETDLSLTANYTNSRIDNPIAGFPTATAEIEAAFPERFTRDAGGRLVQIDSRPVNFARSDREEMRWGINFSKPIGPQPPAGGFRGGGQGRGATPGWPQTGRWRRTARRRSPRSGRRALRRRRIRRVRRRRARRAPPARPVSQLAVHGRDPDPRRRPGARPPERLGGRQPRRPAGT
jgi:hypothetical protein